MNKSMTLDEFLERGYVFSGGAGDGGDGSGDGGGDGTSTSVVNADGTFTDNWHSKYGADNSAHLSRYKTFDDLVNSTIATKKKVGKNPDSLVEIPTETSSDEVKVAFRKASGVPDNVDAYEYTLSDELAVKLGPLQDEHMAKVRKFAHEELELSPAKFLKLLDFYHNDLSEGIDRFGEVDNERRTAEATAAKIELMKNDGWRSEVEYQDKVRIAQGIMEDYDLVEDIEKLNLQNSPKMVKGLAEIAKLKAEDTLKGGTGSSGSTLENINTQIADLRSQQDVIRKENPINFKSDTKFKDIEGRLKGLYQQKPKKSA